MLFTLFCIVSVQDLYALEQLQSTRPNFFPLSFIDCFVSQHDILNQYGFPFAIAPYKTISGGHLAPAQDGISHFLEDQGLQHLAPAFISEEIEVRQ